jgi:hypothetical protein
VAIGGILSKEAVWPTPYLKPSAEEIFLILWHLFAVFDVGIEAKRSS